VRVDVRILCATRRDLDREVQAGRFRDDLFHRIAVAQIRMAGPGRQYYDKRRTKGNSSSAALRLLKRRITRAVFSRLKADEADRRSQATADSPERR